MSRLTELKKQFPELNVSIFDLFVKLEKTTSYKYLPLMCKLVSKYWRSQIGTDEEWVEVLNDNIQMLQKFGIETKDMTEKEILVYSFLADNLPREVLTSVNEFMDYMERNLIVNKDVTSYNSLEEISQAISLATIKETTKLLEGQVIKEFENDTWFVVRPLTHEASLKYGSGTKWCTSMKNEKNHFYKYWERGVLVYFINKKTGYKFAGYKSIHEIPAELTFWNVRDERIDSLQLDIDYDILPVLKKIFLSDVPNKNFCDKKLIDKINSERNKFYKGAAITDDFSEPINDYEPNARTIRIIDYNTDIA